MTKLSFNKLGPEESKAFNLAFLQIASVLQASEHVVASALDPAVPASGIDKANKSGRRDAYEQTRLLLYSAEDHLRTILLILERRKLPTFGLYSLLRPAAEAVVRCAYLLDRTVDETRRLGRGLNMRLENLVEQNKVVRDPALLASRVEALEKKASASGIDIIKSTAKDGRQWTDGFGERRPKSEVNLFATYVGDVGELLYRYLSAHVHSMAWVKLQKDRAIATDEPGISMMPMELDLQIFLSTLTIVLRVHDKNIENLMALAGYPLMIWDEAKKTARADALKRLEALGERSKADDRGDGTV
jgi:hypothetical protein